MHAAADIPSSWNRAIAYGDGLFETILVLDGAAPLWSFHRMRLQQSIQRMNIHCDIAELEKSFHSLAGQQPNTLVKIIVARSGGKRGYDSRSANDSTFHLQHYPLPQYSHKRITDGVRLHVCNQRLSHNAGLAGIKHLNRLEQVAAATERQSDWADEGLMLDSRGAVIEGVSSNIFIVRNDVLATPRLDYCGVAGVMRAAIMDKFSRTLSLSVQETRLTLDDMLSADTVFICNSIFGLWPVNAIGVSLLPMHSGIIEQLWQQLNNLGYARLYG
ncbi:MAG TPA: aminodeoxychorismate lyase [Pseudomonadales bacterium]|nr:aminodeoxychorismate lyase [Pseudomonadales bacterium]